MRLVFPADSISLLTQLLVCFPWKLVAKIFCYLFQFFWLWIRGKANGFFCFGIFEILFHRSLFWQVCALTEIVCFSRIIKSAKRCFTSHPLAWRNHFLFLLKNIRSSQFMILFYCSWGCSWIGSVVRPWPFLCLCSGKRRWPPSFIWSNACSGTIFLCCSCFTV